MFDLKLSTEHLIDGSDEERATFGMLTVQANNFLMSEGIDTLIDSRRAGPMISGIHLAEWLLWNWWRILFEPRRNQNESWLRTHCLSEIGQGFVWPNITLSSDGFRSLISSTRSREDRSFRFTGSQNYICPSTEIESAIDTFITSILGRLDAHNIRDRNIHILQQELNAERSDTALAEFRRFEARLGADPDQLSEEYVRAMMSASSQFGQGAVEELASAAGWQSDQPVLPIDFGCISAVAKVDGIDAGPIESGFISEDLRAQWGSIPAWKFGVAAAHAVRGALGARVGPLSNELLADAVGINANALQADVAKKSAIAFTLVQDGGTRRLVFRSPIRQNRRFEAARMLIDSVSIAEDRLHSVTGSYTYRQKVQRSFGAEFLAPIDDVAEFCEGNYSEETLQDAAEHFDVSSMLVQSLLKNNGCIPRSSWDYANVA